MTDCLENLHICKASCCKVFTLLVNCFPHSPLEDYYRKRGLKVQRIDRDNLKIFIPHICQQLDTETLLCKLHDTDRKPYFCKQLNEKTKKMKHITLTEGCIYES